MEGVCYQGERLVLEPGESLFLYTDGVTEAMNAKEEMFSEERLQKELASLHQESIEALVKGVMGKITDFSEGFPQSDDITMMVLRYQGKK
jgi:sigma-B regulation protein RsbU (phosphoserine phosphatase)